MTLAELLALPELETGFGQREEIRDGRRVVIPVAPPLMKAMTILPDDVMFARDEEGNAWRTGWVDGVQYRQRMRGL